MSTGPHFRVGHGFDAHRLVEGRPFVLGGVRIPFERGPLGHSDADALAHAISDALLGACALGDLGAHFPDTDAQWKDADSLRLLAACHELAVRHGWTIANVDATVVVQAPRLAPHVALMRDALADALALEVARISVKAKTSEGMGYTGDGSGIAAYAVVLVERLERSDPEHHNASS
ncbi:MAG TPA: 2-C-methyl-D-erythritol 2,4-cyclodiphosphate synthase [Candidatus Baltobacteraceae bacterium]|nr:2-C-methyl-D-erythritol 2,4-cyclodiphosphate synthase [Candidatus Baltobacteraceae bacterium]